MTREEFRELEERTATARKLFEHIETLEVVRDQLQNRQNLDKYFGKPLSTMLTNLEVVEFADVITGFFNEKITIYEKMLGELE